MILSEFQCFRGLKLKQYAFRPVASKWHTREYTILNGLVHLFCNTNALKCFRYQILENLGFFIRWGQALPSDAYTIPMLMKAVSNSNGSNHVRLVNCYANPIHHENVDKWLPGKADGCKRLHGVRDTATRRWNWVFGMCMIRNLWSAGHTRNVFFSYYCTCNMQSFPVVPAARDLAS